MAHIFVRDPRKCFRIRGPGSGCLGLVRPSQRTVHALDGVGFRSEPGEIVSYLGPNGAGKSTTIKILSGVLVPDAGECTVDGICPWKRRIEHVRRIVVLFGQRSQLCWDLPVHASFSLLRQIYGRTQAEHRDSLEELARWLDLGPLMDVWVRQLSLGQRMRCEFVAAMLHRPSLLILDEPTIGLDAESRLAMREFVRCTNRDRGVTVILTTHNVCTCCRPPPPSGPWRGWRASMPSRTAA